jgi:hypothetical protein
VRCCACGEEFAKSTTRQFNHLVRCEHYQTVCRASRKFTPATRKAAALSTTDEPANKKLKVHSCSKQRQHQLDTKAALAIVCGARPFSLFDEAHMNNFIASLDGSYAIPHRTTFAGRLLDEVYDTTTEEVTEYLKGQKYLNFIVDESSNILHDRVINLSVNTPKAAFHIRSEVVELGATLDHEWIYRWTKEGMLHVTGK